MEAIRNGVQTQKYAICTWINGEQPHVELESRNTDLHSKRWRWEMEGGQKYNCTCKSTPLHSHTRTLREDGGAGGAGGGGLA